MGPHNGFVVLGTPFCGRRQRSSRGDGLEGNASQVRFTCIADPPLGEILLAQWAVLIEVDVQNFVIALLSSGLLRSVLPFAILETNKHRLWGHDYRIDFVAMGGINGGMKKFVERLLDDEMRIRRWPTDGLLSGRGE